MSWPAFPRFNARGVWTLYHFEMMRFRRTLWQSVVAPVLTTVLYFVVFGAAIGSRIGEIDGVPYGAFIVPGLILLTVFTQSLSNAAFGIYMPRFSGTIYETLSAPVSFFELILGLIILFTARWFAPIDITYPLLMLSYLVLVAFAFSLTGFIIGIIAEGFEALQFVPMLLVTPLTFLGGVFYSIDMLPEPWRAISLFNPIVYIVSGFRYSFHGSGDVSLWISLGTLLGLIALCLAVAAWIIRTGYRLKQ